MKLVKNTASIAKSIANSKEKTLEDDNSIHFKTDSTNISSVLTKKKPKYASIHAKIQDAYSATKNKTTFPPIRSLSERIEISNLLNLQSGLK